MRSEDVDNTHDEVFVKDKILEEQKQKMKENNKIQRGLLENADLSKLKHYHHPDYIHEEDEDDKLTAELDKAKITAYVDRTSILDSNGNQIKQERGNWYSGWNTDDSEEINQEEIIKQQKQKRTIEEIKKIKCSLGEMYLKEQEKEEKRQAQCLVDPRMASRSPNANKETHAKLRYETPVFASPSRTLKHARAPVTNKVPPTSASCNQQLMLSKPLLQAESESVSDLRSSPEVILPKGTSMPDVRQFPEILPYSILKTTNTRRPRGVLKSALEKHLSRVEFQAVFKLSPEQFYSLPQWRQANLKKQVHLF